MALTGEEYDFVGTLRGEASELGVSLTDAALRALRVYAEMLAEWNERLNLTAITAPDEVVTKHFADSLSLLPVIWKYQVARENPLRLLDVGTGAGFPGLALWAAGVGDVWLLDSVGKRFAFINECAKAMAMEAGSGKTALTPPKTVVMRAENAGRLPEMRDSFDAVVARAVSEMRALAELCLPMVRPGGLFYAMKGPSAEGEAAAARGMIAELGGEIAGIETVALRGGLRRSIVVVRKVKATPEKYPRRFDVIKKDSKR
ncbi:MAG: 16S rRNA (guanine(527)-N(7))-methyltransferase RsmG [Defluviitaleaceae bacterium]|nr:16S rRNA (guanine(527)-N(7))-methyltransferase RsmG [Defluviitaleaceae bacterium]